MFDNISYKINENEIKSIIRKFYLPLLHKFLSSDDYKKTRKKYLFQVYMLIIIALGIITYNMVSVQHADDFNFGGDALLFFILLFITYIVFAPLVIYINQKFVQYARDKFINKIIHECINLKEFKYKKRLPYIAWEMRKKQKDEDFLIKNHELLISSELFKRLGDHRITCCAYEGNYKDTYFAIENINLLEDYTYSLHTAFSKYKCIIIKATFSNRLDKEKCNNEMFKNIISRTGKLLNAKETKYNIYGNSVMVVYKTKDELFKFYNFLNISKSPIKIESFVSALTGILIFIDYVATEFP